MSGLGVSTEGFVGGGLSVEGLVAPPLAAFVPLPVVGVDVPDVVAIALSRLLQQDKNKPNIVALLTALVGPVQDVENAAWQLLTQRSIYTAIGAQLDEIGDVVGLPRYGMPDEDYRVRLLVEISVNASHGTAEDLIRIARLALDDTDAIVVVTSIHAIPDGGTTLYLYPDGFVEVRVDGIAVDDTLGEALFSFLERALGGGVRLLLRWSSTTPAETFRFDVGPGFDVGHLAAAMEG